MQAQAQARAQVKKRGGRRPGAGRKPLPRRKRVPHRTRAPHDERRPMHLTLRRRPGLPSFRQQLVHAMIAAAIRRLSDARFQIVHYSIQTNHVHLVAEGADRDVVSRKMSGFAIAVAKRLNRQLLRGRRGKVWSDRYYRRDIERPGEMHAVLRYVFGNAKRHGLIAADAIALDPYSSAWRFDGFDVRFPTCAGAEHVPRPAPRTRLLREDWLAWGLIPIAGAPGPRRA